MKLLISEFVNGEPKAQPRCKASRFTKGVYDPGTANGWKNAITLELRRHMGDAITDALKVDTVFYFPRPKSHYGTGKNAGKLKASAPKYHTKVPDIDNLQKAVYDSLSVKIGIGVWKDDSQIVTGKPEKLYADGCPVGMRIRIYSLEQEEGDE